MKSVRLLRIEDELVREVTAIIRRLRDPRIGMVTVTGAAITGDLRQAKIFVSVLGNDSEKKSTFIALERAESFVRREVGRAIRLKVVPEIKFHCDSSAEEGEHIDSLLKGLHDDT